jgi:hypothetical protein
MSDSDPDGLNKHGFREKLVDLALFLCSAGSLFFEQFTIGEAPAV